ncbi:polysaccharide deacetylase family protein [Paenibacillus sp. SYP-B3998]|uniref:Polysaccharide deacetylase family protein n=1 Tax=Paenibacillus sp. SYP-B3998 TaxID=2678564 RepID=A0A6G3ZXG1_9BACL|nr:polysaccharide deacetylase family protein [Paenibacillus sp. SYP-B3998]NEW06261.1 polysaccharide deacetylase family protein [Paenibacillus sp. SYP-B3998]
MLAGSVIEHIDHAQKAVCLTFDDGPHPVYTPQILQLLKKYKAKATFFLLGCHVQKYPELVKQIIAEGHEVGNHTWSHADVSTLSDEELLEELEEAEKALWKAGAVKPTLFRPPYGEYNEQTLALVHRLLYRMILWTENKDTKDWNSVGADQIVRKALTNVEPGNIVLLHDGSEAATCNREQTVQALAVILFELQRDGYRCTTISELLDR